MYVGHTSSNEKLAGLVSIARTSLNRTLPIVILVGASPAFASSMTTLRESSFGSLSSRKYKYWQALILLPMSVFSIRRIEQKSCFLAMLRPQRSLFRRFLRMARKLKNPLEGNNPKLCHPGERRDPDLQQVHMRKVWAPTFVGVTEFERIRLPPGHPAVIMNFTGKDSHLIPSHVRKAGTSA